MIDNPATNTTNKDDGHAEPNPLFKGLLKAVHSASSPKNVEDEYVSMN